MADRYKIVVDPETNLEVRLKNPPVAALLAWLWPGAGHLYQKRYGKGMLFMVCILGIYFFGLALGGGHVVYASWTPQDRRFSYVFQLGVGLPALPAIPQNYVVMNNPPIEIENADGEVEFVKPVLFGLDFMAPPAQPVMEDGPDQLAEWHLKYNWQFEMGTLYTVVAGLLNVLAIFDAAYGPVFHAAPEDKSPPDDDSGEDAKDKK